MGQTLYLECYSGISGDMTVASLLDLGGDLKGLEEMLSTIPAKGFETRVSRVKKAGIDACDFDVLLEEDNHDHDMKFLHGHDHDHHDHDHHDHDHHDHDHHDHDPHHHDHDRPQEHHHAHSHRGLPEILEIIGQTKLTERASKIAIRIFDIIAEAEAKAHGTTKEQVHFHEVGAVDSIVDILSVAYLLDDLDITEVIVPELCEGRGTIRCQHGILPIPVPAVAAIASAHQLNLHLTQTEGELVTPTGAAIIAAVKTADNLPEKYTISKIGMGAGKREYDRPSMLRAMLIETDPKESEKIVKLETNIDDVTGEALGYTMERLFKNGARDVYYTPIFMKKNRPAYELNVICTEDKIQQLEQIIFEETTTIGIRRTSYDRTILPRQVISVETSLGTVQVKMCKTASEVRYYPEYDSVAAVAKEKNIPFQDATNIIKKEI